MSLYVHCDYCDAHTPYLVRSFVAGGDRGDWVSLSATIFVNDDRGKEVEEETVRLHFCPACSYRVTDDLVMTLKRGASMSVLGQGKLEA